MQIDYEYTYEMLFVSYKLQNISPSLNFEVKINVI
jgi:hypothetical protein